MAKLFPLLTGVFLCSFLSVCGTIKRDPVGIGDLQNPQVPGIPGARYWADSPPEELQDLIRETFEQRQRSGVGRNGREVLVLSGGAENGAYAAGLLNAWSESGTRPEFTTVTGVSTGALIAPFAFLGEKYDGKLREFYSGTPADQIFRSRGAIGTVFNVSALDSSPLKRIIDDTVTPEFLAAIAREHAKGRRLLVQSLSLDAQRPVLWNLGVIASSSAPNAETVFQDALLASASIPGAFPPVLVQVDTPDGPRDEMHVDGAISSTMTALDEWYLARPGQELPNQRETLYVIRNFRVLPEASVTKAKLLKIAGRSLDTLVKTQGTDDLLELYLGAQEAGGRFLVTWIGTGFTQTPPAPFDQEYMQALYVYGFNKYKSGKAWSTLPPQLMTRTQVERIK